MVKNTQNYQEVPMQFSFPHLTLKSHRFLSFGNCSVKFNQLERIYVETFLENKDQPLAGSCSIFLPIDDSILSNSYQAGKLFGK